MLSERSIILTFEAGVIGSATNLREPSPAMHDVAHALLKRPYFADATGPRNLDEFILSGTTMSMAQSLAARQAQWRSARRDDILPTL